MARKLKKHGLIFQSMLRKCPFYQALLILMEMYGFMKPAPPSTISFTGLLIGHSSPILFLFIIYHYPILFLFGEINIPILFLFVTLWLSYAIIMYSKTGRNNQLLKIERPWFHAGDNSCLKERFTPGFWSGKRIIRIHA